MSSPAGMPATVVCTLGMHRSGTSLVSYMLNRLGVELGLDTEVRETGQDNPKGYWEHRAFVQLNDEILAAFGGSWAEPPPFPQSWIADPRLSDLRVRARTMLSTTFAEQPVWGWKDPRTCLTLPFWQELVGPMRYVVCIRNPGAVAASLARRNALSVEQADRLWYAHVEASLADSSAHPRLFVFYDDLLHQPQVELGRMAAFIGRGDRAADPQVQDSVRAYLDESFRHHRCSVDDLVGDARISFPTKALYVALLDLAAQRAHPDEERFLLERAPHSMRQSAGLLGHRAIETSDRTADLLAERNMLLRAHDSQRAAISAVVLENQEHAATISNLVRASETQAAAITSSSGEHTRLLGDNASLTRASEARLHQIGMLTEELRIIHSSRAWTLVKISRRVLAAVLPGGTRRRALFDGAVRRLTRPPASRRADDSTIDPEAA